MISNKADYENMTIKILKSVILGHIPIPEMFPECDEKDFEQILEQCINEDFIVGLQSDRMSDGKLHYNRIFQPYVTFKGLSFIDLVKQTEALEISKSAEQRSIKALLKSNKSYIISVAAFLATLLINADKIIHNARKILSYLGLQG